MPAVLHVIPYMHPSAGGPPMVVARLSELAHNTGWNASVITTTSYCPDDSHDLLATFRGKFDAKILNWKPPYLQDAIGAARSIWEAASKADIVHVHTLWSPISAIARLACNAFGKPYVLSPHGMLDPYSLSVKATRKRLYMLLLERDNLVNASRVVFTTDEEERLARTTCPWLGRGAVIALGADSPPSTDTTSSMLAFRNRFNIRQDQTCLLFLGRIHPKKGIERLIDALPKILSVQPSILLVIAGDGERAYRQRLGEIIREKQLTDRVLFTGQLAGDLKWGAFASATLFVLPSYQENFAISVAEAMRAGVPVMVSDQVNLSITIKHFNAGYVLDNQEMTNLDDTILRILADRTTLSATGAVGRKIADERFSWETCTRKTIEMYDTLLSKKN